jgi:hypothetical protein
LNALAIMSAILASTVGREPASDEMVALQTASEEKRLAEETLVRFVEGPHGGVVAEVASVLHSLAAEFEVELSAIESGTTPQDAVGAKLARMFAGSELELQGTIAASHATMLEWDVDPEGAAGRLQAAIDALPSAGGTDS